MPLFVHIITFKLTNVEFDLSNSQLSFNITTGLERVGQLNQRGLT